MEVVQRERTVERVDWATQLGPADLELAAPQFRRISQMMYRLCGLTLPPGKEALVRARLIPRLRALGLPCFADYLRYLVDDQSGREVSRMVDALTTHETRFFRERPHFEYLRQQLERGLPPGGRLRLWSVGCASGQEPFSLAMLLWETLPDLSSRDVRILATDVSASMVASVRAAVYDEAAVREVPAALLHRYFTVAQAQPPRLYQVHGALRALVRPAQHNLIERWPMRGPFDAIFCRNVMIYFDRSVRQSLLERFWSLLRPGACLFIGRSEGLSGLSHAFRYVAPGIYAKDDEAER